MLQWQGQETAGLVVTHTWLTADGSEDLKSHVSDLLHTERQEIVLSEELINAEAEQLKYNADVTFMIEPVHHPHTGAGRRESVIGKKKKRI